MNPEQTWDLHLPGVLITRLRADVTVAEVLARHAALLEHPAFAPGVHTIWDVRGVSAPSWTLEDVRRIGSVIEGNASRRGEARVAVLVDSSTFYGIVRMLEQGSGLRVVAVRPARTIDAAVAWVCEGVEPGADGSRTSGG